MIRNALVDASLVVAYTPFSIKETGKIGFISFR